MHGHLEKSDWVPPNFPPHCGLVTRVWFSIILRFALRNPHKNVYMFHEFVMAPWESDPFWFLFVLFVPPDVKGLAEKENWVVDNEGITSLVSEVPSHQAVGRTLHQSLRHMAVTHSQMHTVYSTSGSVLKCALFSVQKKIERLFEWYLYNSTQGGIFNLFSLRRAFHSLHSSNSAWSRCCSHSKSLWRSNLEKLMWVNELQSSIHRHYNYSHNFSLLSYLICCPQIFLYSTCVGTAPLLHTCSLCMKQWIHIWTSP